MADGNDRQNDILRFAFSDPILAWALGGAGCGMNYEGTITAACPLEVGAPGHTKQVSTKKFAQEFLIRDTSYQLWAPNAALGVNTPLIVNAASLNTNIKVKVTITAGYRGMSYQPTDTYLPIEQLYRQANTSRYCFCPLIGETIGVSQVVQYDLQFAAAVTPEELPKELNLVIGGTYLGRQITSIPYEEARAGLLAMGLKEEQIGGDPSRVRQFARDARRQPNPFPGA